VCARVAMRTLLRGRSTSPLDGIMIRLIVLLALLFPISIASGSEAPSKKILRDLQDSFAGARSLPPGSRPEIPMYLNIYALTGVKPTDVREVLGAPNFEGTDLDCGAPTCWAFTFGPRAAPIPPERDLGNGSVEVTVVTGGPWYLLLGIEHDLIKTVAWRGQR